MNELTPEFVFKDTTTNFPNSTIKLEEIVVENVVDIFIAVANSHRDNTPVVISEGSIWDDSSSTDSYIDESWIDTNGVIQGYGANTDGM